MINGSCGVLEATLLVPFEVSTASVHPNAYIKFVVSCFGAVKRFEKDVEDNLRPLKRRGALVRQ